jgi:hypothetical protein
MPTHPDLTRALLVYAASAAADATDRSTLFPTLVPEAAPLVASNPYAFAIACCLDRGAKADLIWTIPYYMAADLGHLDPWRIGLMSLDELAALFRRLPRRPRYLNSAPRTVSELTRLVTRECAGDAGRLWTGKRAAEVHRAFSSIYGVGPGIASMTVLLIETAWGVRFPDLDRPRMDIKPDVHTMRVLYRLGAADATSETAAIAAARRLNPAFPGGLDGALWLIGRNWCHATAPDCAGCPVAACCPRAASPAGNRS